MKKILLKDIQSQIKKQVSGGFINVYMLKNGNYIKFFDPILLLSYKQIGIDIEQKINDAKIIPNVPEIIIPEASIYDSNNQFVGYLTKSAKGINYNEYDKRLTTKDRTNLLKYAKIHNRIENILRRGNTSGIVFPDILSCDNIFINNDKIQLIDYDGMQVGKHNTAQMSTSLGRQEQYEISKYSIRNGVFTPNLDKKSSILLFYLTAFNIDLNKVGEITPYGGRITLDDIFNIIGLNDADLMHKTWLAVENKDRDNEYLGDTIFNIADKYDIKIIGEPVPGHYMKKLVRK